ncbi:hypothetical protein LIS82_13300 [Cytobacillus solani]|uniref:hypothetical protein n=1 Tax=Cytobacillus solani TaxID=1637975 RepID=UPI00207ABBE5|nr:hypothetical protein [Cytobacillus solani]USK57370.1 hypothetical protein LIS82_13300 [Cytobacillus solani]
MATLLAENPKLKERAEEELSKFFVLAGNGVNDLKMPKGIIDEVWHEKLNDQESYTQFCNNTAGCYVEHIKEEGKGNLSWVTNYEEKFGKLDSTWFMDKQGQVNKEKLDNYSKSGKVSMEWGCGPIMPTQD